ncbi:efflux RND transporter periplasmic adaptor subunit [uncultured Moraxella sp.]|uniref:efflux RND transporter periplasmic adaptor subunit n=1 Tax=uncultured Moraxella sp. TaxID=263769 RepID=UPI0025E4ABB1|nr:efflux RND transporter periplasmic adaptor subunit [uncultured Moraxella sp.]
MTTSYKNSHSQKSKFAWWQLVAAVVLVAVGVFIGKSGLIGTTPIAQTKAAKSDTPEIAEPKAVMAVEAVTPTLHTIEQTLSANGLVAATETAEVSGQLTGVTVERVLVDVGDVVKAGQVLAVLDTKTLSEQTAQAQADLAVAEASYEKAQTDLNRTEPLLAIDAVSRQEVDGYRTALKQAQANITAAKARLNTAKNNEANAKVTAPVSGVISAKSAQVGVLVTGASLFSIIKDGAVEWQATLSSADAGSVRVGQPAQVTFNNQLLTGTVTKLSPTANSSREMIAHVKLSNGAGIKAGMYLSGQFILTSQSLPTVPLSAILNNDGMDYVWVLTKTDTELYKVVRTQVTIQGQKDELVAVDVPTDQLIVAKSASFLNDGDLVTVASVNAQGATDATNQPAVIKE